MKLLSKLLILFAITLALFLQDHAKAVDATVTNATATTLNATRVSGAWTPASLGGSLVQWVWGDFMTTNDAVAVTRWNAKIGTDMTTDTTTGRPTVITNGVSGKAIRVVRFNGTANYLTNVFGTQAQPFTMFVQMRQVGDSAMVANYRIIDSAALEAGRAHIRRDSTPNLTIYSGVGFQGFGDTPNTNWSQYIFVFDGANSRLSKDGSGWLTVGASPGTDTIHGNTLGVAQDLATEFSQMDFEQFGIISGTNWLTTDYVNMTNYLHLRIH